MDDKQIIEELVKKTENGEIGWVPRYYSEASADAGHVSDWGATFGAFHFTFDGSQLTVETNQGQFAVTDTLNLGTVINSQLQAHLAEQQRAEEDQRVRQAEKAQREAVIVRQSLAEALCSSDAVR
jgi:hypothetical protein